MSASIDLVGVLALNRKGVPAERSDANRSDVILRKATEEPEVMPSPWNSTL